MKGHPVLLRFRKKTLHAVLFYSNLISIHKIKMRIFYLLGLPENFINWPIYSYGIYRNEFYFLK